MAKSEEQHPSVTLELARTPLYPLMVELNARLTAFSGWEMPVQFSGITQEHQAVRTDAGLFDISHMGKFTLRGANLIELLQPLVPSDLSRLQPGQAQYSLLLNSEGGILDDIIFYYQGIADNGDQQGVMIVNAATRIRDKAWLFAQLENAEIELEDLSLSLALIALQGPTSLKYLQNYTETDLSSLPAFGHCQSTLFGSSAFIARTGYTGEDGFEIMVEPEIALKLWQELIAAGVTPCGLGARDTLRLEAAMCLYGQDIDEQTTPWEAGLGWVVHLDSKQDFIGRESLEKQKATGVKRRLVGLQMQGRNIARHNYPVVYQGEVVGKVTSGTLSPTLNYPVALAYVPIELSKLGQELAVDIRGKTYPAKVVKKPFYRSTSRL